VLAEHPAECGKSAQLQETAARSGDEPKGGFALTKAGVGHHPFKVMGVIVKIKLLCKLYQWHLSNSVSLLVVRGRVRRIQGLISGAQCLVEELMPFLLLEQREYCSAALQLEHGKKRRKIRELCVAGWLRRPGRVNVG
jgi:hypothetical protein